jgi:hypothetical protein
VGQPPAHPSTYLHKQLDITSVVNLTDILILPHIEFVCSEERLMKPFPRTPSKLSDSLNHRLNMYALAASAARSDQSSIGYGAALAAVGLGMLALPQAAQAKIIYTPANQIVSFTSLDLNHDGTGDFFLAEFYFHSTNAQGVTLFAYGVGGNAIVQAHSGQGYAAALHARVKIGGAIVFVGGEKMATTWVTSTHGQKFFQGPWANSGKGVKNKYLGFKFLIRGKLHYGWARLNVRAGTAAGTLTGYAYETIPNKPIITGKTHGTDDSSMEQANAASRSTQEPAGLGHLAQGFNAPREQQQRAAALGASKKNRGIP